MATKARRSKPKSSSLKAAALAYAARGWPVFPCIAGEKRPLCKNGVLSATIATAQIEAWWTEHPSANIALNVGDAGFLVIDLDPGHDEGQLEKNLGGPLPETELWATTPRGGEHLYFEIDRDEIVAPSASKLAPHVDVRSFHSYVLLPPSRTADGEYTWGGEGEPAFRSDEMLRLSNAGKEKSATRDERIIDEDMRANVRAAKRWLKHKAKLAVEGEGGDQCTYDTGCMMHSYGISEAKANELMLDHWNDRCSPPWEPDEMATPVTNAYRYHLSDFGNCTDAYHKAKRRQLFEKPRLVTEDGERVDSKLSTLTVAQVLSTPPVPVAEIIPDRCEKGIPKFLSGGGGSTKSLLSLQYHLCVMTETPVFGGKRPEQATSVYVSAEDDENEVRRRMHKLVKRLELPRDYSLDGGHYLDRHGRNNSLVTMYEGGDYEVTEFYHQLGDYITGLPGHKFVVLDSAYDFVRFDRSAKINEDAVNAYIKEFLNGFCRDTNSTLLIPYHPSQAGLDRGDGTGWSVAWNNAPRVRDVIKRVGETDTFELKAAKRNHGACPPLLKLRYSGGAMMRLEDVKDTAHPEQQAELEAACIAVAIECADSKMPIQRQRHVGKVEFDLLAAKLRDGADLPTRDEFKDILNAAVLDGGLKYVTGTSRLTAGYYPPESDTELAKRVRG